MRLILSGVIATSLLTTTAYAQSFNECRHSADRSATVDASNVRMLRVDAGSGSLKVVGKPGLRSVIIRGKACASSNDLLDDIKLEARREGSDVVVRANVHDDDHHVSWRGNQYARLDVVMEVPAGMAASIDDGSGDMELEGLGNLDVDDGSGGIVAMNIGSIVLDDGSGEIDLSDVHGTVEINDGSGEITLHNIDGAIDIEDGSGEIRVRNAKQNVRIRDSSGDIDVADIGGDFIVPSDGSGGIDYDNVRGRVDIPRKRR